MDENTQEIQQAAQSDVDMDDFDAGFNDGVVEGGEGAANAASPEQTPLEQALPEQAAPEQTPVDPPQISPEQVASYQASVTEQVQPAVSVAPQAPPVEISAEIAEEFAELERLSPRAAELARENSPEGAAIRDRLERLGADSAFDRAEVLLDRRERAAQEANAQQQAIEAYNRNFQQVLRTEHPDLFAPSRTPEQNQRLMSDMKAWIESKPYAEARGLMEIYEGGRDPRQVAALLTRFKQEAGTTGATGATGTTGATGAIGTSTGKHTVDPTAMMAVAGRGAPIVPKTVGGKDDFESGWNL